MEPPFEIYPDDELLRRYDWRCRRNDGSAGSGAFELRKNESYLSVYLERLTSIESVYDECTLGQGIVAVLERQFSELGLAVSPEPLPNSAAHCKVVGQFSPSIRRKLADASRVRKYATNPGPRPE